MFSQKVMSFCVAPDDNQYEPILIADCQEYVHFTVMIDIVAYLLTPRFMIRSRFLFVS